MKKLMKWTVIISLAELILIDGIDICENPVAAKKKIGYMPESAPLYGDMIVEDYLKYVAKRVSKVLEKKNIWK